MKWQNKNIILTYNNTKNACKQGCCVDIPIILIIYI
nr:MAG TPA: Rep protein+B FOLD, RBD-LIKE FOLD, Viral [Caudoviricetes sp.]